MTTQNIMGLKDIKKVVSDVYGKNLDISEVAENIFRILNRTSETFHTFHEIDLENKFSYNGSIYVQENSRGKGIARNQIEKREELCTKLDMKGIIIKSANNPFWEYFGYRHLSAEEIDHIKSTIPIAKINHNPMYKDLR